MKWQAKLLSRTELPAKLTGTPTLRVAKQIVGILESGRFDEQELEEALLMVPGLISGDSHGNVWKAIGRQLTVPGSGKLDLLFANTYDDIRVIELKAREIQRGDLMQALDYARTLEEMESSDLAWHITIHSGRNGVPHIWNPDDLRIAINWAKGYSEEPFRIQCMVIGISYRPNIARLARRFGVGLKTVAELCENWNKYRGVYRDEVPSWQSEEDGDEYDDE